VESELNISLIYGGGVVAEQNILEEEWIRSQKNETPSISAGYKRLVRDRNAE